MNLLLFMNFTMNFSQGCFQVQYKYQIYELEYKYYKLGMHIFTGVNFPQESFIFENLMKTHVHMSV